MTQHFVEFNPVVECELNGKLESEARKLECRAVPLIDPMNEKGRIIAYCIASACAHWRWLHKGGTRYEKRTFESEMPIPDAKRSAPADVPDGWAFIAWDSNMNGTTAKPRFWAKRAVEVILPRGLCGLAHGEEV